MIVQQPGQFTAPFCDRKMGVFVPALVAWFRDLPMNWFVNWFIPPSKLWLSPFNRLAQTLGLPEYKSPLDFMAGDLTLVMDTPEILGISKDELENETPRHPERFHRPPRYRQGSPLFARLPGDVPDSVSKHFDVPRPKLYCGMGVSGSPQVLNDEIDVFSDLDFQALIVTTTILAEEVTRRTDRVMAVPHVPAHRVNPLADIALTHGGAGTVQTAIHAATPLVGVQMHLEQAGNISLVARQGAGVMLYRPDLTRRKLGSALEKLVTGSIFPANMQRLQELQDYVDGARNAAREIIRFLAGDD